MISYVIDSYAWIEYFMGSRAGERAREIIDGKEEKLTPAICLAEVYAKTLKVEDGRMAEERRFFIKSRTAIVPLNEAIAVEAAKIDAEMKRNIRGWGLADSIVAATAKMYKASILTGDEHFKTLPNVILIE